MYIRQPLRSGTILGACLSALLIGLGCAPLGALAQTGAEEDAIDYDQFGGGYDLDDPAYADVPRAATLMRGNYATLPARASLKAHAPTPAHQGANPTCSVWATAYGAQSILKAMDRGWTDPELIADSALSPIYVYQRIRYSPRCTGGASAAMALELMRDEGNVRHAEFEQDCAVEPDDADTPAGVALAHQIQDFTRLFDPMDNNKVLPVKKALAEGHPVVLAMGVPGDNERGRSFVSQGMRKPKAEVWTPTQADYGSPPAMGHAVVIVGYDDDKFGGAVEVMNSWGKRWGQGGFMWMRYTDLRHFAWHAFEVLPKPQAAADGGEAPGLSGTMEFVLESGGTMDATYDADAGLYRTTQPYPTGTVFRVLLANHQPAYVYALASDTTQVVNTIFPPDETTSPYLPYDESAVALPGEDYWTEMYGNPGTEYYAVLYSPEPLEIDRLHQDLKQTEGSLMGRLRSVLGESLREDVTYAPDRIHFSAEQGDGVAVIVLAVPHIAPQ